MVIPHFSRIVVLGAAVLFLAYAFATDQPQTAKKADADGEDSTGSGEGDDSEEEDKPEPEPATSESAGPAAATSPPPGSSWKADTTRSLVDVASESGRFGTWSMAVRQAGLVSDLEGAGPLTVFPPTDEAFGHLGAQLDELLADNRRLAGILRRHIARGGYRSGDLHDGQSLDTLAETTLRVTLTERGLAVGGGLIIEPDLTAANGVIHGINTVLIP